MTKNRLEAFSDGVIAIILTIMVLELRVPASHEASALWGLVPGLLSYLLSFVYVAIYWNNHHHLLQAAKQVSGGVLWANMHLLFWLSLVPFTTEWIGHHGLAALPIALYGVTLLMAAVAYFVLVRVLIRVDGRDSVLAVAIGADRKGLLSLGLYAAGIAVAWWMPWLAAVCYVVVAGIWLVPDYRIAEALARRS